MAGISSKRAGKRPARTGDGMDADTINYRSLLVEIAGPTRLGDSVKAALGRIARRTGLSDRRVRAIWHGEVKDIRARELAALLSATRDAKALEAALEERDQLLARIAACKAALGVPTENETGRVDDAPGGLDRRPDRSLASEG